MLNGFGYHDIQLAYNGLEAIHKIDKKRENNESFDLILLDIRMPVMDGYGVIDYMKKKKYTIPVIIAVTACVMTSDKEKCKSKGVKYFITKPVNVNQLRDVLYMSLKSIQTSDS